MHHIILSLEREGINSASIVPFRLQMIIQFYNKMDYENEFCSGYKIASHANRYLNPFEVNSGILSCQR